jgi:RNA polymerase sigma-70 factor (ECF subfamily)
VDQTTMALTAIDDFRDCTTCISDPDTALVQSTKSGDISAFEELVRKYDRKLFRIALNVTHNIEDAQEAVQTAFFKAYTNLDRFEANAKFSTWLTRIAVNESLTKLRKLRSQGHEVSLDYENSGGESVPLDFSDWHPNPEQLYGQLEFRELLSKALNQLSPALRVVFVLRDIQGLSYDETAIALKLETTAIKSRLYRARLQLREELSKYFSRNQVRKDSPQADHCRTV